MGPAWWAQLLSGREVPPRDQKGNQVTHKLVQTCSQQPESNTPTWSPSVPVPDDGMSKRGFSVQRGALLHEGPPKPRTS